MRTFTLALMLLCGLTASARAQLLAMPAYERFELGRRVRAFEETWDKQTDAAARRRGAARVAPVTGQFFSFQFGRAGETLDLARLALLSDKEPHADTLWAESLTLKQATQLLDRSAPDLEVTLQRFYTTKGEQPEKLRVRLYLFEAGDKPGKAVLDQALPKLPATLKVPLKERRAGDYFLRLEIVQEDKVLAQQENYPLSLLDNLATRLDKLKEAREKLTDTQKKTLDAATLAHLQEIFTRMHERQVQETAYPVARLLKEAEEAVQTVAEGKSYYGNKKPGSFWLAVPAARGRTPLRILAPQSVQKGEPIPLVIALHGAGGSENMFFDAYGNGGIVRLCQERGWLLAAPRDGQGADKVIEELGKLYSIDTKKVFVVGHSMGAQQAITLVGAKPLNYRAVAALGGGGRVRASDDLKNVAAFVGLGTVDRIGSGAKSLHKALQDAGVKEVEYREYQGIDHLVVVQIGLPDVFAFFDKQLKK